MSINDLSEIYIFLSWSKSTDHLKRHKDWSLNCYLFTFFIATYDITFIILDYNLIIILMTSTPGCCAVTCSLPTEQKTMTSSCLCEMHDVAALMYSPAS